MTRRLEPTPGPWWYELGIVYGADGEMVAQDVQLRDGSLVAAAPALLRALAGMVCRACTYPVGAPREGPACSSCADARAAFQAATRDPARRAVIETGGRS